MKKLFFLFVSISFSILFLTQVSLVQAKDPLSVIVFVREGCQHCADEEKFLNELQQQRSDITVQYYRLENAEQRQVWEDFTARIGSAKVTPLTVVGSTLITGFDSENTTGKQIIDLIESNIAQSQTTDLDSVQPNQSTDINATCPEDGSVPCVVPSDNQPIYVSIPFMGSIDVQSYPLVLLSAVLGFIDGFNPCAMWVLVTFLIILTQLGSRRKMITFAGVFILAEAIMYYLILTVWFKTWDFIKLDQIVTPIVGLVAIGAGLFFLRAWKKAEDECKVTGLDERHKTRQRIEKLATGKFTIFTFLGILGLAFSVNIIEFACSIGIPQTFTKIIEINNLSFLSTQGLILNYILFYMIDDFIVFGIALYSIDKLVLTSKYSRWSHLIGGVLMVGLGLIMLLNPSLLMF